ncbi:beta-1,6-galactanase [Actinomadura darangshiensis]|uniref:Beta-1,6-galactanase n=1 Tax=Actinomadura darangshiensis TaxID=705336 RepID=A0A4R5A2P6_9ACTN|nr:glycoside hydrolase [Actinomadura darangshiensis]TDD66178.1 beta-1,6-galactanase [Actinomadura darangshiensis]
MSDERVIDAQNAYIWDGWGTCLSWWANTELGGRDDLAAALFGLDGVRVGATGGEIELPGLGLNIVRYNLGACTWTDGSAMIESPAIVRRKQIETFCDGDEWDWSADANQRTMLSKARDAGADTFEMFSVSPPWWMTVNGNPSGAEQGDQDNLAFQHQKAFAQFIAVVAKHARDQWKIRFTSVDPFNEPSLNAWHAQQNQEGCHFTRGAQEAVLECLRGALDEQGLDDVLIAASDECHYSSAADTWRNFSEGTRRLIGRVNVHAYERDEDCRSRAKLREAVGEGTPIWQSEYSEGEPDGLSMALSISRDVQHLRPRGWVCWQPVEALDWGLLDGEYDDQTPNPNGGAKGTLKGEVDGVNTKYYVLAHYTRHIRPTMRILQSGHTNTVAAHDATARRLALVTVNDSAQQSVTYNLRQLAEGERIARVWVTDATNAPNARRYAKDTDISLRDGILTLTHDPNTVTTIEIDEVEI